MCITWVLGWRKAGGITVSLQCVWREQNSTLRHMYHDNSLPGHVCISVMRDNLLATNRVSRSSFALDSSSSLEQNQAHFCTFHLLDKINNNKKQASVKHVHHSQDLLAFWLALASPHIIQIPHVILGGRIWHDFIFLLKRSQYFFLSNFYSLYFYVYLELNIITLFTDHVKWPLLPSQLLLFIFCWSFPTQMELAVSQWCQ